MPSSLPGRKNIAIPSTRNALPWSPQAQRRREERVRGSREELKRGRGIKGEVTEPGGPIFGGEPRGGMRGMERTQP